MKHTLWMIGACVASAFYGVCAGAGVGALMLHSLLD